MPTCEDQLHGALDGVRRCEWEDIVIPTAVGIYLDEKMRWCRGVLWSELEKEGGVGEVASGSTRKGTL